MNRQFCPIFHVADYVHEQYSDMSVLSHLQFECKYESNVHQVFHFHLVKL